MIVFFIGDISRTAGTERVTTVIASALADQGFPIAILSMNGGTTSGFPLHHSVKLFSLHMEERSANFSELAKYLALRRFILRENVRVIVNVDALLCWYSIPASASLRVKVVSWEHFHRAINPGDLGQKIRRRIGRWIAVRSANCVVTLTERDRRQYIAKENCRSSIMVIPNPITLNPWSSKVNKHKRILAAGRLVPQKGFDLLIHAWSLIAKRNTEWRLQIVGSGPQGRELRELARELKVDNQIEFYEHSSHLEQYYLGASLFAMTSRFEGLPLVLIEAKKFGLPCISFDCACGPSEIIRDGVDGILIPDGDVPAMATGLEQLIQDEMLRLTYSNAAQKDTRFDLEPITDLWLKLLKNLRSSLYERFEEI